ncbi:hypothetical protein MNEG_9791 [Monoraphidium neglectum]|uniref:EGF-like domain-containing protein n=1 Tax=Monoraphidium neglectum TaxID=145388 RepID=A0A0D2KRK6_9CHLO|nr:hypothetical protein MNEG_9791 [Monoraphidium neglectum]KIY98173.1 hypothetical protein MNEG_9791 [Monoraphidium neglectum]|eukprot:XP_013897193.1 hypothetical protein MNEG_9791 [Monoraphidium neglectum]
MGRSRPYKQRLRIYVALIISALAVQLGQASARVCIVDLEIKGSALTLGGHVHEPVEAKLVPYGAAEASGVVSVALSSAGESCPPAAGDLRAALAGAVLVAPAGGRGVAFGSLRTSGPAAGASGVAVRGLKGALMSSARGPAEPLALSLSPRSGAATLASAAAAEPLDGTSFKGAGCALRASGGQLRLDCRELKLEGRLVGEGQISALLQISGSLTAAGKLADAKAAPSDLPPPLQSQATRRRALLAEAPPPALGARGCAAGAAVAANGSCACAAGWGGRDCSVCRENSVCPGFTGQPNSTCDANLTYGPTTSYKAYDCDLIGGLSKWVTGVAALCNVRGERLPFGYGPLGLKVSSTRKSRRSGSRAMSVAANLAAC